MGSNNQWRTPKEIFCHCENIFLVLQKNVVTGGQNVISENRCLKLTILLIYHEKWEKLYPYKWKSDFEKRSKVGKSSISFLTNTLKTLVKDSRMFIGLFDDVTAGSHHFRKLAAAYGAKMFSSANDEIRLRKKLGCSAKSQILEKYKKRFPPCPWFTPVCYLWALTTL